MRSTWVVMAVTCAACTQYTTYGYQYKMQQSFGGEEPEDAPREARELLATARTVAFYPPDVCINVDTGGVKAQQLHANCGVLMSSLERAAEGAGYEVVSWQNLRGNRRAIDFAREANVDVLFEVNEFDLGKISSSQTEQRLSFFEQDGAAETPLSVSNSLAQSCIGYAASAAPARPIGQHGTIDIKTVSVADGRMRWRYRKVVTKPYATATPAPQRFRGVNRPRPAEIGLGVLGGIALAGGVTLLAIEHFSPDDPLTPQVESFDASPWSTVLTVAGAAAIVGAVVYHYSVGTMKADPETTLCDGRFAIAAPVGPAAPPPTTYSTEHTFSTTQNVGDSDEAEERELSSTMIAQFIDQLKAVHPAGGPPPPPPPAPSPAQPAPAGGAP